MASIYGLCQKKNKEFNSNHKQIQMTLLAKSLRQNLQCRNELQFLLSENKYGEPLDEWLVMLGAAPRVLDPNPPPLSGNQQQLHYGAPQRDYFDLPPGKARWLNGYVAKNV
ncbi:hypothetical protein KIN20_025441 [Parelaphostrongylus tenuis]|uniref:Uncharacterized protein n=1 Tax=Parelaphostrongylus tenuis TaxID=148309 RepID=A0AAD5QUF2_PARTN|nr:hypothetical protein KIN20_025441 [Parelaphostrongylus tenuis]